MLNSLSSTNSKIFCPNCNFALSEPTILPLSPVQHMFGLRSNAPPSPSEASLITKTIANSRRSLAILDDEIKRVQSILSRLVQEKAQVAEYLEQHTALISPARGIPPEIVSEIFLHCVFASDRYAGSRCLLRLSQICRGWRAVSLSTPSLWCSLRADADDQDISTILQTWLSRSDPLPFHLDFASFTGFTRQHLDFVLLTSNRLQVLKLSFDTPDPYIYTLPRDTFKVLESLEIYGRDDETLSSLPVAFGCAPRLRQLTLREIYPTAVLSSGNMWAHLTELCYDDASPNSLIRVLGYCLQLERCEASIASKHRTGGPYFGPHVTCPYLTFLNLTVGTLVNPHDISNTFRSITTPALQELRVELSLSFMEMRSNNAFTIARIPSSLISFFERSSCSLHKFSMHRLDLSKADCIRLFTCLSSVTDVSFSMTLSGPDDSLEASAIPDLLSYKDGIFPLPNLEYLNNDWVQDIKSFVSLIDSRWRLSEDATRAQASRLKEVAFCLAGDCSVKWPLRLRQMLEEGLKVTIRR